MMDCDVIDQDLTKTVELIRTKKVSAQEVAAAYLARAEKINPQLGAYISLNPAVKKQAEAVDSAIAKGETLGKLAGAPLAIKDLLCTQDLKTTAGSKILENFTPPYSATVVDRLLAEGGVVLGKANLDEFAMGSSNENSAFGLCRNPWDQSRVPGGSSGGSAVAVAAQMAVASIGTDTGGSIRQPASFCGVVGVKPTYGRVSRYGIVAFASSLDQAGPMTQSVRDAALMLEVISGRDPKDGTSANQPVEPFAKNLSQEVRGTKIGLPKEYFGEGVDPEVRQVVDQTIQALKALGAEVSEITIPLTEVAVPIYYLIATSEASSNLARYDGVRYGYRADFTEKPPEDLEEFYSRTRGEAFGAEVKRRIMLGTYALSSGYYDAYYKKASQVRRLLRQQFIDVFDKYDVILSPVSPTPAFEIGDRIDDPLVMYLNDVFTTATNLAGIPGMSVPGGFSKQGLPIGIQLMAGHFQEQKMLDVAFAIEEAAGLKERRPDVT